MLDSKISLYNLVKRYTMNKKFLIIHPENKELLERKIKEAENNIFEMLVRNENNELLKRIE
jgi:hypothetical protein